MRVRHSKTSVGTEFGRNAKAVSGECWTQKVERVRTRLPFRFRGDPYPRGFSSKSQGVDLAAEPQEAGADASLSSPRAEDIDGFLGEDSNIVDQVVKVKQQREFAGVRGNDARAKSHSWIFAGA